MVPQCNGCSICTGGNALHTSLLLCRRTAAASQWRRAARSIALVWKEWLQTTESDVNGYSRTGCHWLCELDPYELSYMRVNYVNQWLRVA
jgi:hypothetical protein